MSSPQVEYRQLGKSGLRVSVPILGAMSFGSDKWAPWVINEAEVRALLATVPISQYLIRDK
jgi:aryl-alcohol dehydrogenase-like predicted oxidoreductase